MVTTFRYLTSKEWGMTRRDAIPRTEMMPDPEGTLHHTAGNPGHYRDAIACFQDLNALAHGKDYDCVPYDILVHERWQGADTLITIGEGRGPYMSAATLDRNEQTEAVCALGYFHPGHTLSEHPTSAMVEGCARGFVYGIKQGWISSTPNIYGHRDNPAHPSATGCPGDYLYPYLPIIRTRVVQLLEENFIMHGFIPRNPNQTPRIFDTRSPDNAFKLGAGKTTQIAVPGSESKTQALVTLTAVEGEGPGYFTAWPSGDRPLSSCLNWGTQQTIANTTVVDLAADGSFQMYSPVKVHVVVDLVGYFQPM